MIAPLLFDFESSQKKSDTEDDADDNSMLLTDVNSHAKIEDEEREIGTHRKPRKDETIGQAFA